MLTVTNLTKYYGTKTAVDHISFSVQDGEILGFLGPNGAGKSTTMNMITGYLGADDGTIFIDDIDMLENPLKAKTKIGYLPEKPPLYPEMTVRGYLKFIFRLKGLRCPMKEHIEEICRLVHIDHVADRIIRNLSKGYQQRVGIAQAMLGYPRLLILDEPTVGLDPLQITEIRSLITELSKKQTIILSSHILSEIAAVCTRILVLHHGRIIACDSTDSLTRSSENLITLTVRGSSQDTLSALSRVENILHIQKHPSPQEGLSSFSLEQKEGTDILGSLSKILSEANLPIYFLGQNRHSSLEEVFLHLTQNPEDN